MHPIVPGRLTATTALFALVALTAPRARAQGAPWFMELAGGWNYSAPAAPGDNYSRGNALRASIGREIAPHVLLRFDAARSAFDHNVQFYPPCAPPGCSGPFFFTQTAIVSSATANLLVGADPRGVVYFTAGAGIYDAELHDQETHLGASVGAGIAIPIRGRLRAVVEGRYHALVGATNGPPWILPVTIGLRY